MNIAKSLDFIMLGIRKLYREEVINDARSKRRQTSRR